MPVAGFTIAPKPAAHFGVGAVARLPAVVRATGADQVVVVTDAALAAAPVIATVMTVLAEAGLPARLFSGVPPTPTTDDIAAGAAAVAESAARAAASASASASAAAVTAMLRASAPLAAQTGSGTPSGPFATSVKSTPVSPAVTSRIVLVAVGGGPPIDAAKGIAIAAVNPQRGRDLDYRGDFAVPALPIVAVPTTAGPGTETTALGLVTDPASGRTFYVGHASSMPAAVILDPALTVDLPPAATAAAGLGALARALEAYLSARANPWSDGIARQAIRMVAASLPRACADGADLASRSELLLAAHLAGVALASTGPGPGHAIARSLGARWDIAPDVALAMLLPGILRVSLPVRTERLADVAFALGAGDTHADAARNAAAAIAAITALRDEVGLDRRPGDFGVTEADFGQITAEALSAEALSAEALSAEALSADDIRAILRGG